MPGLWDLLVNRKCAITRIPSDRWSLERFGHPRHGERGRSYTWAAGILDDVWGFDAGAFGLSPREAEQMDPQQRLLLELTWEALEDAGIRPSDLAGTETGVFVGASTLDHGNTRMFDIAATDAYFATGNAASILANRVSYVFDLSGPSFTVDTACSSSLVALDAAVQALRSGRIDTAIVGGVSILLTPFQFISFSQASMLSRTGLCQAFSAKADGYVRAEGGGVLVLRAQKDLRPGIDRAKARIVASRVNSDGRTNGIALPSKLRQARLLEQLYDGGGIDPDHLAFVEAHGTGTPVGDPIEATAIGEVLGVKRSAPLPIGSVKSNIGHSEAAAGLAGIIKATLALEHDLLPPTLHCDELNPNVDFARLNLRVAQDAIPLARGAVPRLAGVSSYGFGGTNTHVVLADAPADMAAADSLAAPTVLMLSAHTRAALTDLARRHVERLGRDDAGADAIAAAANNRRDALAERLVVPLSPDADVAAALQSFIDKGPDAGPEVTVGTAVARRADVAFVYSGNGSQWVGMGRAAYGSSAAFRAGLDEVDALFGQFAGWSLAATLNADDLVDQLGKTSVAQPLIFAIQAATTRTLKASGLMPSVVLGHSVGEVAAAEAAGILDLRTAVKVIYYRSLHQELAFGAGGMAVLVGSRETAETLAAADPDLSIAAYNSPRTITFSGTSAALAKLASDARAMRARVQKLDIAYPFHSGLIAEIEEPLLADLGAIPARDGEVAFVSTVTGAVESGRGLDRAYWWRNVREPVLFSQAIEEASRLGARVFVEIGPSPILLSHINDTLGARGETSFAALPTLERKDGPGDPFRRVVASALTRGARVDAAVFGSDPGHVANLPPYPWQRKHYRLGDSNEIDPLLTPRPWHPLIGARTSLDQLEWHGVVDVALVPALADHVIDGHVLVPGAAFAEMALAVARDWLATDRAAVADFEIHQPMILDGTASRETRCRVQPVTGFLEIMSRPRLTQGAWQVHVTAKVLRFVGTADPVDPVSHGDDGPGLTGAEVYAAASTSGLQYGPAFQLLHSASRSGADAIAVALVESTTDARYGFDPTRVDACFHGLVLLFSELAVRGRLKPYVPVAIGELKLFQPGAVFTRALIRVRRADARTIVVDFSLVGTDDQVVASFYGVRFQAMQAFRSADKMIDVVGSRTVLAAEPLAVHEDPGPSISQVLEAARATGRVAAGDPVPAPDYVLLEGWATSAAFGLFEVLADDGIVDVETLVEAGRLPSGLRNWCARLLAALEQSGLATATEPGRHALSTGVELPDPRDILRTLAAEHPDRSADLLLAAHAGALVDAVAAGRPVDARAPYTVSALDAYDYGGRPAVEAADLLGAVLDRLDASLPKDRAIRVLQVGDGPLSALVADFASRRAAELTVLEIDRRRLERVRLALDGQTRVFFSGDAELLAPNAFDLVVAAQTLHATVRDPIHRNALAEAMAPGAVLLAVEPEASLFRDLVFGLAALAPDGSDGLLSVASEAGWRQVLGDMGLTDVAALQPTRVSAGLFVTGRKAAERTPRTVKGEALVVGSDGPLGPTAAALATMLKFSGLKVASRSVAFDEPLFAEPCGTVIWMVQAREASAPAEAIALRCLALRRLAADLNGAKATLWLVCPGATRAVGGDPVESAIWAFARTLANEVKTLDVRLIDLAPDLSPEVAARRLRDVVLSETAETEIVLDASSTAVLRFERTSATPPAVEAGETVLRLVKGEQSGLDRMVWATEVRRMPGPGEVEIEVGAAGLNFRDVMWGLSILPEEILEDGYAGATLGLECAGRVVRVGSGVERLKVGDRVMAFAKAALATHVTVESGVVAAIPDALPIEAAATVPVAFLTAFYALTRCARLAEDEWVLIHGGAGGVGLAALQIALWRGARVIATAGSAERRDLLTTLGADHVFDSRSSQFVDDIRAVTAGGVDVVLNSLSGEAMERSIAVLRPFGRFVELGKRDYVANTHIGLKPFRRNLSYFGVDLDQLILKGDASGQSLFEDVMGLFDDGSFTPLPYRVFPARETVDAFRVMQKSGHVGKIVILPPTLPEPTSVTTRPFRVAADRTHLVTGGLRGFGLETARWLVARGARHLVLLGRSGASSPEAQDVVAELEADGVAVEVAAVDVTNEADMTALLARVADTMPPLGGVIHAATVYDDAIVANLTREKLDAVLITKVAGASLLDRLTRSVPLDYFILYSSATTLIGNPGQGAYVAANAFLEGLARRRREEGLPGFAVAWGAIEDVGVLARSGSTATSLLARTGVQGMTARAALERLADALSYNDAERGAASLAVAAVTWSAAREHLPVLQTPVFSSLMHGAQASEAAGQAKIVVRDLVEQDGIEGATSKIAETLQEEIARILRLPREDVSRNKPLMEIGLDSLMAVELGMGLEQRFALDAPLSTSAGAMTVNELAEHVVGLSGAAAGQAQASDSLSYRHLDAEFRAEVLESFPDVVQQVENAARTTFTQ